MCTQCMSPSLKWKYVCTVRKRVGISHGTQTAHVRNRTTKAIVVFGKAMMISPGISDKLLKVIYPKRPIFVAKRNDNPQWYQDNSHKWNTQQKITSSLKTKTQVLSTCWYTMCLICMYVCIRSTQLYTVCTVCPAILRSCVYRGLEWRIKNNNLDLIEHHQCPPPRVWMESHSIPHGGPELITHHPPAGLIWSHIADFSLVSVICLNIRHQPHQEGGGCDSTKHQPHQEGGGCDSTKHQPHQEGGGCDSTKHQPHQEGGGCDSTKHQPHQEGVGVIRPNINPTRRGVGVIRPNINPTRREVGVIRQNINPTRRVVGVIQPNINPTGRGWVWFDQTSTQSSLTKQYILPTADIAIFTTENIPGTDLSLCESRIRKSVLRNEKDVSYRCADDVDAWQDTHLLCMHTHVHTVCTDREYVHTHVCTVQYVQTESMYCTHTCTYCMHRQRVCTHTCMYIHRERERGREKCIQKYILYVCTYICIYPLQSHMDVYTHKRSGGHKYKTFLCKTSGQ